MKLAPDLHAGTKGIPAYRSPAQELKLLRSLALADIPEA